MARFGMVIDTKKCVGCMDCVVACKTENDVPEAFNRDWIVHGGFGKDDGYAGLKRLYQRGAMPEFIFAATYPVALGIYEAAKELDIRIPDNLDIICFGDSDVGRFLSPALSVVRQPTRELGMRAVQVLLESIAEPEVTREHHVILPTQLVIRETCAAKRADPDNITVVEKPRFGLT